MNKKIAFLVIGLFLYSVTKAQTSFVANNAFMSSLDSNVLKLKSKLYKTYPSGDLNIYGFDSHEVPYYSDAEITSRLNSLECEIPLNFNIHVKSYIDLYTVRRRKLISKVLKLSEVYFPVIEEIFDRENVPLELKYLAVIESALNHAATSRVGAAGMWQFMAPTGAIYGLKTTAVLDERRDFIKSTEASVKYFKNSYAVYGDWLLVIASYNCGVGNVNRAIRRSGGKRNFWEIMPYLPKETRGYVPAFIAATYAMSFASEHNIYPSEISDLHYFLDTVQVDNRFSLEQLSLSLNMPMEELKRLNPSLKRNVIPFTNSSVTLTLPFNKVLEFTSLNNSMNIDNANQKLISLANASQNQQLKPKNEKTFYKVRKGDQLASIANKFDVSVAQIKKWNKLRTNKIKKGQNLKIYPNQA